jgi:hypothetical protein
LSLGDSLRERGVKTPVTYRFPGTGYLCPIAIAHGHLSLGDSLRERGA